ncbi:MAG: trypsin-like serine protease [Gammaproteobacteria bacterium]|nr:trypsin-like serine protease [Gammaproteobacteria bacterium]
MRFWRMAGTAAMLVAGALILSMPRLSLAGLEDALAAIDQGDLATGVGEITRLAGLGDRRAQYVLAMACFTGVGVEKNRNKAISWLQKSVRQNYPPAQAFLGGLYYSGRGILRKDYAMAFKLYRKAAEQGVGEAQYMVGLLYTMGKGVSKSYEKAAKWHKRGANQGIVRSQVALGVLYSRGKGVPRNYVESYKWYTLAMGEGDEIAAKNRSTLPIKMTEAQITEAERLAANFQASEQKTFAGGGGSTANLTRSVVKEIQLRLTALGYKPGPIDGYAGRKTASAVKAYQTAEGLEPNGLLTRKLYVRLKETSIPVGAGSGILVDRRGHVVTAYHVVGKCDEILIRRGQKVFDADLLNQDKRNDLALIQASEPLSGLSAEFRLRQPLRLGEDVIIAGFPMQTHYLNVSVGSLNALTGYNDNVNQFQMSAPIQSGYSGGPVLDRQGAVIGVVVSTVYAAEPAKSRLVLQNVNFATKSDTLRKFLEGESIDLESTGDRPVLSNPEIAQKAGGFTVVVECLLRDLSSFLEQ